MDWKSQRKIDAHIHVLPDEVHEANPDDDSEFAYAKGLIHLALMDEYNIDKSIIMTFNDPFLMSMDFTVSKVHENLRDICLASNGRYFAFADIDTRNSVEVSCQELRKALAMDCFKGIKIHPNNSGMNIDDEYNDLIFLLAEELDVPIAIHSYPSSDKKFDQNDYCTPFRIARIMQRHPKVKVLICHMGGFQWRDCLELDACLDISAVLPDLVQEYGLKETNKILRKFDINKLFLATDWPCSRSLEPYDVYPQYINILNEMDFSEFEKARIAYSNIAEFLGI